MWSGIKRFMQKAIGTYDPVMTYSVALQKFYTQLDMGKITLNLKKCNLHQLYERLKKEKLPQIDFTNYDIKICVSNLYTPYTALVVDDESYSEKYRYDKYGQRIHDPYMYSCLGRKVFVEKNTTLDNYGEFRNGTILLIKIVKIRHHKSQLSILNDRWSDHCMNKSKNNPFTESDMQDAIDKKNKKAIIFLFDRECPMTYEQKGQIFKME